MILTDHVETQNKQVLVHLVKYGNITSLQAFRLYKITRLASIIMRLKRKGNPITSTPQYDPDNRSRRWAKYELLKSN